MRIDSDRIRQERERRAWSQEKLAQVTGLGLRTIQRIESTGQASSESTLALASVFEIGVGELALKVEQQIPVRRGRQVFMLGVACSLLTASFVARIAFAEQIQVDIGVNINGGVALNRTVVAHEGSRVEFEFENQLKTVITPSILNIDDRELVSVSLQVFERSQDGGYTLLESPELVHQDGGQWEIKVSGTPSGKSYRLVVRPQIMPS